MALYSGMVHTGIGVNLAIARNRPSGRYASTVGLAPGVATAAGGCFFSWAAPYLTTDQVSATKCD
ncbi:hypothetical protein MHPYR_550003 [uncultured Mycobacterium sp.]|uniref:Uncharacterized protein n=1 Tax=uncultured Mycobacterium sp. TaxID=171292 RepID=A0A1Y5PI32_9MYCO|nr:hypothetical protein MHPYR_550003 [uncultured Mycobacterium sp.]